MVKYISRRPRGFNIQVGADAFLVFPQNEAVDVPNEFIAKVEAYCPKYLGQYTGPGPAPPPSPKKKAREVKSQPPLRPKGDEGATAGISLSAANIPQVAIAALASVGITDIAGLTKYVDEGKSLSAVKGIGEKLETEIIGCLAGK